jgi:centromeric protein E
VCVRIKPTASLFAQHAYEVSPHSLTLSNTHPNVVRRGGKAGREAEYTYNFGELPCFRKELTCRYPGSVPDAYTRAVQ